MSSSDIAVSVRGLSKSYSIAHNAAKHTTAGEALMHKLRNPFAREERETFWALNDVNFDIQRGDVVGIIGRNGAGKSTLLKILSRITEPTTGQIDLYGRVGSLLEVGTGFHPELTGRENIFLNGAILGMAKSEITKQFDAIVDFAEVEKFLDTPVKRYSSGMYVRLAFAVAAHLNPEILIVDEVLAVGDIEFQKKCLGKMHDVAEQDGRTVIFVSHNMTAVQSLCSRAIILQNGSITTDGNVDTAIALYQATGVVAGSETTPGKFDLMNRKNKHLMGQLIVHSATIRNAKGHITSAIPMGEQMSLTIDVKGFSEYRGSMIGIKILSANDLWVVGINTEMKFPQILDARREEEQVILTIPSVPLVPGQYWIDIGIDQKGAQSLDYVERAAQFEVIESDVYGTGYRVESGVVYVDADWRIQSMPVTLIETAYMRESAFIE
jgi:lipopolysaccharide transport system ATP-binding protein